MENSNNLTKKVVVKWVREGDEGKQGNGILECDAIAWFGFKDLERNQRYFRRREYQEAKGQR